ncbi:MAG: hypothetical protein JW850_09800 [Thermoflexales bacterium]|nr:hypothetical protein [Thermoflexales bacterium]
MNLHTGEEIVTQSSDMNAETTARHLQHILDALPDVDILLLWDRAPWLRGPVIRKVLGANSRLEIMWFPVAHPSSTHKNTYGKPHVASSATTTQSLVCQTWLTDLSSI